MKNSYDMGTIASFTHYGYEYSVFQAKRMFKVKRTSKKTGKTECAFTDDSTLFDNCDDKDLNELLQTCTDRIFLSRLLQRHRESLKSIRALFTTQEEKTSHSESKEAST